ncbi:hypothetical protein [Nocardioides halotolerans]|uniref:hypothetical protein n=1 Tax=Nocardioides halotolerans TaxID=433660 RepID=UPI0012FA09B3|nr:hypothetical protein [Nocardioides halotolerans]
MANDAAVERMRALLEAAAAELEARREDVLSSTLVWPGDGLDAADCAAFLLAVDERRAVLDAAGYVTVPRSGRYPLLRKSGIGVEVDLARVAQVSQLAAG